MRQDGIKNGLSLRGPFSASVRAPSSIVLSPPIPDPTITPVRSKCSAVCGFQPESSIASVAAARAKWRNSSILLCSFGSM